MVYMDVYRTPPKRGNRRAQKLSIAERARQFARHWSVAIQHVQYFPYRERGVACFYYGTHLSMSDGFSLAGINPRKSNTEFSAAEAFYVTNIVTAAFEFLLHNWLARNPEDTMAIFCFELDLKILHEDIACPSGEKFISSLV
jgi:hypothetical protein